MGKNREYKYNIERWANQGQIWAIQKKFLGKSPFECRAKNRGERRRQKFLPKARAA